MNQSMVLKKRFRSRIAIILILTVMYSLGWVLSVGPGVGWFLPDGLVTLMGLCWLLSVGPGLVTLCWAWGGYSLMGWLP